MILYKNFFIKNPKLLEFLKKIDKTYYFVLDKRNIDYKDGLNRIACIKKDYPNSPFNKIKELKQANLSMEVFAYLDPIIAISINNTNNNILISSQKLAIKQRSNGNIEIFFIDKRLIKEHNKLVERFIRSKYNEPNTPLKIHRKFNKLSLDSDYKRIEDTYSLYLEGEIQNHCVYSYRNKIDSGKCVIYTTDYENKKYTIEITKNNRNFVLEQIRGKYNSDAPLELKILINQKLNNTSN